MAEVEPEVRAHAAVCGACAELLEEQRALTAALRLLAAASPAAPERLEARLRSAVRERARPGSNRLPRWWAAAAAVVLAAVALWPRQAPPPPRREVSEWQGFLPLSPAPFESARVVRVRLPRSSLAALGLPVSPERSGDVIQADVVYADDGIARAIRFVQ